jgi:hypothetical protein
LGCEGNIGRTASFIKQSIERRRATAAIGTGAADVGQAFEAVATPGDRRPDRVLAESPAQAHDHRADLPFRRPDPITRRPRRIRAPSRVAG